MVQPPRVVRELLLAVERLAAAAVEVLVVRVVVGRHGEAERAAPLPRFASRRHGCGAVSRATAIRAASAPRGSAHAAHALPSAANARPPYSFPFPKPVPPSL